MLHALTTRQVREWEAFYEKEPFGDYRGDVQAAIIAQTIAAVNTRKGKKPPPLVNFMPYVKAEADAPRARLLRNFRNYNGRISAVQAGS